MAFDQEHRGDRAHAHFMRSFCQRIYAPVPDPSLSRRETDRSTPAIVEEPPAEEAAANGNGGTDAQPRPPGSPRPGDKSPRGEKKKKKGAQIAERHPKPHKRGNGPPGNPPAAKSAKSWPKLSPSATFESPKLSPSNGKILLFVSKHRSAFLHLRAFANMCSHGLRFPSSTTRLMTAGNGWRQRLVTPVTAGGHHKMRRQMPCSYTHISTTPRLCIPAGHSTSSSTTALIRRRGTATKWCSGIARTAARSPKCSWWTSYGFGSWALVSTSSYGGPHFPNTFR